MHLSKRFPELFDEAPFVTFSPSQAARISGIFPENQRLYRSRLAKVEDAPPFPEAPYDWHHVVQLALMAEIIAAGVLVTDAWKIAGSDALRQIHDYDQSTRRAPLFIFARPDGDGRWAVSHSGKIDFDTANDWWGNRGFWFNYSNVHRRAVAAYEAMRRGELS